MRCSRTRRGSGSSSSSSHRGVRDSSEHAAPGEGNMEGAKDVCCMDPAMVGVVGVALFDADEKPGQARFIQAELGNQVHLLEQEEGEAGERVAITGRCQAKGIEAPFLNTLERPHKLQAL